MAEDERPPLYYRPGEVRELRDGDRRCYRRRLIWFMVYLLTIVLPLRLMLDWTLRLKVSDPRFLWVLDWQEAIRPFVTPGIAATAIVAWVFGILVIFRRRY